MEFNFSLKRLNKKKFFNYSIWISDSDDSTFNEIKSIINFKDQDPTRIIFFDQNVINLAYDSVFILESNNFILINSDISRSITLFFFISNNLIQISDDIYEIKNKKLCLPKVSSFILSGYSFADETIFNGIKALQAGEVVLINKTNGKVESHRYFSFIPSKTATRISEQSFVETFNKLMDNSIQKMIHSSLNVNNWIVPLSGGHDSRQIINSLYKLGVKNVVCFSYGKPNNHQAKISQQVANAVGYPWYFVEYTEEKWKHLHDLGLIDKYVDFAFQGVSTPHLQDFLAVYELKERRILNDGDVFIPGHTLDMISGGHFSDLDLNCKTKEDALLRVGKRHSKLYDDNLVKKSPFFDTLSKIFDEISLHPSNFQEYINWQERQAKFIVNSCRVYEFFGYDFRLPFWDRELVEFFLSIPTEQRKERNFFKEMERKGILIPELAAIPFEDEVNTESKKKSSLDVLKNMLPKGFRSLLSRWLVRKQYEAESLNQIYALKAKTVGELLGPIDLYPRDTHAFLKPLFLRPTHRVDYHLLSGLYAVKRAIDYKG